MRTTLEVPFRENAATAHSLSHVWLFATPCTVAHQVPLFMGFSRQEYWSGLPCPPPGDLPDPGIKPRSPAPPALAGGFFITEPPGKPLNAFISVKGCEDEAALSTPYCLLGWVPILRASSSPRKKLFLGKEEMKGLSQRPLLHTAGQSFHFQGSPVRNNRKFHKLFHLYLSWKLFPSLSLLF